MIMKKNGKLGMEMVKRSKRRSNNKIEIERERVGVKKRGSKVRGKIGGDSETVSNEYEKRKLNLDLKKERNTTRAPLGKKVKKLVVDKFI